MVRAITLPFPASFTFPITVKGVGDDQRIGPLWHHRSSNLDSRKAYCSHVIKEKRGRRPISWAQANNLLGQSNQRILQL
ncbi:hypothetical protein WN944_013028 [Citrus x changshan-huyou]|uniref:Uncharacterized protein n=1 Tax=Citrus x changshan-huyou TaxID=2935761 RepID=A0AAP0M7V9_9ROSI